MSLPYCSAYLQEKSDTAGRTYRSVMARFLLGMQAGRSELGVMPAASTIRSKLH